MAKEYVGLYYLKNHDLSGSLNKYPCNSWYGRHFVGILSLAYISGLSCSSNLMRKIKLLG